MTDGGAGHGRSGDSGSLGDAIASDAHSRADVVAAVDIIRGRLSATRLPLNGAGVDDARSRRRVLLDQLDDYLLPRLRSDGAPLLVVVGGSTGAGKSTLVNSLLGAPLATPGVLRPTTRSPVLIFHPADAPWFAAERILPTLTRVHTTVGEPGSAASAREDAGSVRALRLAPFSGMPPGLALLDAPDVDSVETANRDLATQLLAAADLWLFVTTAARYADAVPWEFLQQAADRHAQIALVIDRVDAGSEAVVEDLRRMAAENGLADAPLFMVPEADLDDQGMLPERAVGDISRWLTALGGSADAREDVAVATRDGVVADVIRATRLIAAAADEQATAADRLVAIVTTAYAEATAQVEAATRDGAMLRGEVLGRWQDFVGASDLVRSIERGAGRVRDSITSFFRGGAPAAEPVEVAIAHGLEAVTIDALEGARERIRAQWRADPAGSGILIDADATAGVTGVSTAELRSVIAAEIRGWQGDVLEIVREQGAGKRGLARGLSFGVNGLGVALMLVVFSTTGGLTGIEVGVAGGTALAAQKVLEAVFGDDAVRQLAARASERLTARLNGLVQADASIALTAVAALGVGPRDGAELRAAADALATADERERAARTTRIARTAQHGPVLRGASAPPYAVGEAGPLGADDSTELRTDTERPGFWKRLFGGDR